MDFLSSVLSWLRLNRLFAFVLVFVFCNGNFQFSDAQHSTIATTMTKETLTSVPTIECNLTTQCFLNETQLDPLLNCTVSSFGETDPPCYGYWTSASSCSCIDPSYRISSDGAKYWCNPSGSWDHTLYALQCQAPCITDGTENAIPRSSDGNVSNTIKHGDFVTYTCPEGYTGSGTQTVDCNDGIWEPHEQFTCTEITKFIGSTSSTKATVTPDNFTTIPMTTTQDVTSDAGDMLASDKPTTVRTTMSALPTARSFTPTTLRTATTTVKTTPSMYKTTLSNDTITSMETTTSTYPTTETAIAVHTTSVNTKVPTSMPVDSITSDSTPSGSKLSTKIATQMDDATHRPTTKSETTRPSTKSFNITTDNYRMCPSERIYFSGIALTFAATHSERSVCSIELCGVDSKHSNESLARRFCTEGSWDEPLLSQCYSRQAVAKEIEEIANETVTTENVEEIAGEVALLTSQTDDVTSLEVDKVADTLQAIVQTGSSSPNVTYSVVGTVNNLMEIEEAELEDAESTNTFIVSLERQISNIQKSLDNFTDIQNNVGVKAVKLDPSITEAITFINVASDDKNDTERLNADLSDENTLLFNDEMEVKRENGTSSIYIPSKVVELAQKANQDMKKLPFSFFIYKDARLFQTNSKQEEEKSSVILEEVVSQVIAATVEIENIIIGNLSSDDAVITRFLTSNLLENGTTNINRRCVFWKVSKENEGSGSWSTEGCKMESSDRNQTVCKCSHLTSFAVIFRYGNKTYRPIASLDIITKIGTSLSVVGLTACILTLTLIKKCRQKQPTKIHTNLCLCLIGFYVTFMAGEVAKENKQHCRNLASATHYFCLATVTWTCAEAVNMYFLFVKYSRTKIKYFVLLSCLLCYGLPLIPTIIVSFLDNTNMEHYCFLHPGNSLYFGLFLEILVMMIFNIVVFSMVVLRVVCRPFLSTSSQNNKRTEIIARMQHFVLFWILLGLSWTFGFLLIIPTTPSITVTLEVLFCIFTSLQGFILFLFICVKNPDVKKIFKRAKRRFRKNDSSWMKNRKGSYSVSDMHNKMDPKQARVESCYRNHTTSEESEFSISEQDVTYASTSRTNASEMDHSLPSESENEEKVDPEVNGMDPLDKDEIMQKDGDALEPQMRFRQKVTRNNSQTGKERVKKKVVFV